MVRESNSISTPDVKKKRCLIKIRSFLSPSFPCSLTKGRPSDGFFLNVEDLIRQAIKEFEYPDCTIFKQLVQTIAPVAKVGFFTLSAIFLLYLLMHFTLMF